MADTKTEITLRLSLEEALAVRFILGNACDGDYSTTEQAIAGGEVYDTLHRNLPPLSPDA